MSESLGDDLDAPGATGVEARASDWFQRRHFETWSDTDQVHFDAWLSESPAHEIAYWRLEGAWARTKKLVALRPPRTPERRSPFLVRIAAAGIAAIAIAVGYWIYQSQPRGIAYATSVGGHEAVMLGDGSRIELNTDTAMRVSYTSNERIIWLEKGEAYFEVVHDSDRPLVVFVGDRRVTDLGTKFIVRQDSARLEVAVVEGRVSFDEAAEQQGAHTLLLSQGDTVVATPTAMSVTRKLPHEISNELGWRRGVLIFDGTPLAEAANEINRYNVRKIVIADRHLGKISVTGTLSANDPDQFMRMTRYLLALHGERAEGNIQISR